MPSFSQTPGPTGIAAKALRVTQLFDVSVDQQELSRDYSTGVRLAFAELARAGQRVPALQTVETDGSPQSLQRALRTIQDDPSQAALLGTAGERLALASIAATQRMGFEIAYVAPWLSDTRFDGERTVFPLFASRESQIAEALKSLATSGISELGLVFADARAELELHAGVKAAAAKLQLRTERVAVGQGQDARTYAASLPEHMPAMLLFLGGAVELAVFTQALSQRGMTRYVVCLADVDTTTLLQLGSGKSVPLIFTQVVPNPHGSQAPVVRAYRSALAQMFDESPSPVSLAGYLAGRFAAQALAPVAMQGDVRKAVLAELQRSPGVDLGGFRIDLGRASRRSNFVSQSLLRADGKLIG